MLTHARLLTAVVALLMSGLAGCTPENGTGSLTSPAALEEARALHAQALRLVKQGRSDEALAELERAVELAPDLAEAHLARGRLLLHLSDVIFGTPTRDREALEQAIVSLRRASELRPADAEAAYWTGRAQALLGERDEALASLRRAVELDPELGRAHVELGRVLAEGGEVELACESLERATRLLPDDTQAWFLFGMQLEAAEDVDGARRAYERAIELDWTVPGPHSKLSVVLTRLGDGEGAEREARAFQRWSAWGEELNRAIARAKAAPDDAQAQAVVGRVYEEAGRLALAASWYQRALRVDPRDGATRAALAALQGEDL